MHLRRGVEIQPDLADGQNNLGAALARFGALDESVLHLRKAVDLAPQNIGYRYNFGRTLAAKGRFAEAATQLEQAAKLSEMKEPVILQMLAAMYGELGRFPEATATARRALALAAEQKNQELESAIQADLRQYER